MARILVSEDVLWSELRLRGRWRRGRNTGVLYPTDLESVYETTRIQQVVPLVCTRYGRGEMRECSARFCCVHRDDGVVGGQDLAWRLKLKVL